MPSRTTIYLDDDLLERARRFVPARGLSHLLNELLAERIAQLERQELEEQMRQGYIATREDRQRLGDDWRPIDAEGWPA